MPWMSVISDLNCKKIGGTLSEKELQKKKKNKIKNTVILLTVGLMKKKQYIKWVILQSRILTVKTNQKLN